MKKITLLLTLFFLGCIVPENNIYQKNFIITTQEDSGSLNISICYKTEADNCRFITLNTIEEVVEYKKEAQFLLAKLEETEARFKELNSASLSDSNIQN